ncbi:unnamed protein product [Coccothraustes coccothraustes]
MVLGAGVLWELLATSLECTMDERVYEYLDFADATDSCFFPGPAPRQSSRSPGCPRRCPCRGGTAGRCSSRPPCSSRAPPALPAATSSRGSCGTRAAASSSWGSGWPWGRWQSWPFTRSGRGCCGRCRAARRRRWAGILAAQLLSHSLLREPWAALPVRARSGLGSGALRRRTQGTVGDAALAGTERALLALLRALGTTGAGLGSLGAGVGQQRLGLPLLLRASCVGLGLWILFFLIARSKLPRQRKINYSRLLAADSSEVSDSEEEREKDWLVKAMKDESFNRNWIQQPGIS